jgi:hypothetical protein
MAELAELKEAFKQAQDRYSKARSAIAWLREYPDRATPALFLQDGGWTNYERLELRMLIAAIAYTWPADDLAARENLLTTAGVLDLPGSTRAIETLQEAGDCHLLRRKLQSAGTYTTVPNFLVIGGPRCASTSVYFWLKAHPSVVVSLKKETRYFSDYYLYGDRWYSSFFPNVKGRKHLIGEVAPTYLCSPWALSHASRTLSASKTKIIVLKRDPHDRSLSHHAMLIQSGAESRSFEEAIADEQQLRSLIAPNDLHRGYPVGDGYYLSRLGAIPDAIDMWRDRFSNLLEISFFEGRDSQIVWGEICQFLGLEETAIGAIHNRGTPD